MSFYGNKFMYYENTSYEDTMNFFQESYENIQIFFDDIHNMIFKEESTELVNVSKQPYVDSTLKDDSDNTKTKKFGEKIIQFLKMIFQKFVSFCTSAAKNITEFMTKLYQNININDSMNRIRGGNLSYNSLLKAKEKGYKGMSKDDRKRYFFIRPIKLDEHNWRVEELNDAIEKEINPILSKMENYNRLTQSDQKEFYKDIKEKLSIYDANTKKSNLSKDTLLQLAAQSVDNDIYIKKLKNEYNTRDPLVYQFKAASEDDYTFPDINSFNTIYQFATRGEKEIKKYKKFLLDIPKNMKSNVIDPLLKDCNTLIKISKTNNTDKDENDQDMIKSYHLKAKADVATYQFKASTAKIKDMIEILKAQHDIAIRTFIYFVNICSKYKAA